MKGSRMKAADSGRAATVAGKLADLIGQQIADGVYRAGDKLPSLLSLIHI